MFLYQVQSKKENAIYYTMEAVFDHIKQECLGEVVAVTKGNDTGSCWTRHYKIVKCENGYGIMEYAN